MSETAYIDKYKVYEEACAGCWYHGDEVGSCNLSEPCEKLVFAFASAPAADVAEVVRCRDCKYVRPVIQACDGRQVGVWCYLRDADDIGEDDFCSQGERKDGGENDVSG